MPREDGEEDGEEVVRDFDSKKILINNTLNAETPAECLAFGGRVNLGKERSDLECFGPPVSLSTSEGETLLPPGDLGIWCAEDESGEATIAAKMNDEFQAITARTDFALLVAASLNCLARVNDIPLPTEEGESLDLTDVLEQAIDERIADGGVSPFTPTSATITFEGNVDGRPAYTTAQSGTVDTTNFGREDMDELRKAIDGGTSGGSPTGGSGDGGSGMGGETDGGTFSGEPTSGGGAGFEPGGDNPFGEGEGEEIEIESDDDRTMTVYMSLTNIPLNDAGDQYKGILKHKMYANFLYGANCPESSNTAAASLLYEKGEDGIIKGLMRSAVFCGNAEDSVIFDEETGELDPRAKYVVEDEPATGSCADADVNENGWGDTFTQAVFNIDPDTGYGTYTTSWQAGRCDGNTRVTNITITEDGGTDGNPGGCGYYGFGPDMAEADSVGNIDGMICIWTGTSEAEGFGERDNTLQELVQRQCVTYDETAGLFVSDDETLKIGYTPSADCDGTGGLAPYTCDDVACPDKDLLDIGEMDFTQPTPPSAL